MRKLLFLFLISMGACTTPNLKSKNSERLSEWNLNGSQQYVLVKESNEAVPVIVFVHGGPGNPLTPYAHMIDSAFMANFNVVHWDQRHSGLSFQKTRDIPLKVDEYVVDLTDLLKQVKILFPKSKVVLVGASWGSLIGIKLVQKWPKLVDYYVGIGQMILPVEALKQKYVKLEKSNSEGIEKLGPPPWKTNDFFRFVNVAGRSENYENKISSDKLNLIAANSPYYTKQNISVIEEGQVESVTGLIQEIYGFNAFDEVKALQVPTLFIQGDQDWITPTNLVSRFVATQSSNVSMLEHERFGHNLLLEMPATVAADILMVIRK